MLTGTPNVTLSGTVTGANPLTLDATSGTIQLIGTNTNTGAVTLAGGLVQTNNLNALGNNSAVTLSDAVGTQLQLLGNLNIGSLAGAGTVSLGSFALVTGANNTSTNYIGLISGTGSLTKNGTGIFNLTNANTYSGGTTLSLGTLGIYDNASIGSGALTAAGGTTVMFGRNVTNFARIENYNFTTSFALQCKVSVGLFDHSIRLTCDNPAIRTHPDIKPLSRARKCQVQFARVRGYCCCNCN
ncbi:MAG: hypothetical protein EBU84_17045 [Actinobacteria bacterium]|nr:hypothetical protein [Actinomycetota bacterium]